MLLFFVFDHKQIPHNRIQVETYLRGITTSEKLKCLTNLLIIFQQMRPRVN